MAVIASISAHAVFVNHLVDQGRHNDASHANWVGMALIFGAYALFVVCRFFPVLLARPYK
jgi:hypothetical protein